MIGAGVALVVVLALAAVRFSGSGGDVTAKVGLETPSPPAAVSARVAEPLPAAKAGKTPTTPAPELPAEVVTKADAFYLKAKKMDEDGRRAQAAGDNKLFNKLMNDSWDTLELLLGSMETHTDWLEEADLEGWRLPPAYVTLQKRLGIYFKLRGRVRRVKGNRQK
jgi:hypothetical protein